jgi:hypothetical protein
MKRGIILIAALLLASAQLSFAQKVNEAAGASIRNGACMGAVIPAKKDGTLSLP